jgi:hypothetical protein
MSVSQPKTTKSAATTPASAATTNILARDSRLMRGVPDM